jgi:lipopolysaccharide transport system ATP-binding protein
MIRIENLVKEFRIYKKRSSILKHILGIAKKGVDYDSIRTLDKVTIDVPKGRVHGIIGMNGAGKSTLLKILTKVIDPTQGSIQIEGRVAALLELGTGFHVDLTGRENVYLNGSTLGLSRAEIDKKIGEIQSFAELGDFFDRPVKIYSSGMYVRLAFSFAVSVDPDVLIIDEALSVGDAYFQQKCLIKVREYKEKGTTILFVSHDLGAVRMLCDEVTLLSRGKVIYTGEPLKALDLYNALLAEHQNEELVSARVKQVGDTNNRESFASGNRQLEIQNVSLFNADGDSVQVVTSGEKVLLRIECKAYADEILNPTCGILIKDRLGYEIFGTNTHHLGLDSGPIKSGSSLTFEYSFHMNLGPGEYTLTVALHSDRSHVNESYHWIERALLFKVLPTPEFSFIGVSRLEPNVEIRRS